MDSTVITEIKAELEALSKPENVENLQRFFKTKKGEYGYGDIFIGVRVPDQRKVSKKYASLLSFDELSILLYSEIHEHRLTALFILVLQYQKSKSLADRESIFTFYLDHSKQCNNWDLVDSSAHHIVGAYTFETNTDILFELVESDNLWQNRIAMIATLYHIRKGNIEIVYELARTLLNHKHDLMHKAVGWMLREAGKCNFAPTYNFIRDYYEMIPRTALRYAIEKQTKEQRDRILKGEFLH